MSREVCPKCQYPLKTCLCAFITPVKHKTKILVLQHPSEVNNKKNTIRVLSLLTDNIDVIVGEKEEDFLEVKALTKQPDIDCFLLFPSEQAKTWQQYSTQSITENNNKHAENLNKNVLIVIDGTWRKAKKIHLYNNWLKKIPHLTLERVKKTNYGIRKSNMELGLSSIEAVAFALEDIENSNNRPFIDALEGLKTVFTQLMPEDVKKRYIK